MHTVLSFTWEQSLTYSVLEQLNLNTGQHTQGPQGFKQAHINTHTHTHTHIHSLLVLIVYFKSYFKGIVHPKNKHLILKHRARPILDFGC